MTAVLDGRKTDMFLTLREAGPGAVDTSARVARAILLSEGLGNLRDLNWYTPDAIASAVKVFEGKQFYVDHPSASEEENRPERSVRDLAGYFFDCRAGQVTDPETGESLAALYASLKFSESEAGQLALDQVKAALDYQKQFPQSKDVYCGLSINGGGVSHPGEIDGMAVNVVAAIQDAFSADIVTKPARGGKFVALTQEAARGKRHRPVARGGDPAREARRGASRREGAMPTGKLTERDARAEFQTILREGYALIRRVREGAAVEDEAREQLAGKIQRLRQALTSEISAPDVLIDDLRSDLGQLRDLLVQLGAITDDDGSGNGTDGGGQAAGEEGEARMAERREDERREGERREGRREEGERKEGERREGRREEGERREGRREEGERREGRREDERREGERREGRREEGERREGRREEGERREAAPTTSQDQLNVGDYGREGERREDERREDERREGERREDEMSYEFEDGDMGMGDDHDAVPGGQKMAYKCASCGETNMVVPPKGMQLTPAGEGERRESVRRLEQRFERMIESARGTEARFGRANEKISGLVRENTRLRARLLRISRYQEAATLLRRYNIPRDILSPEALVNVLDKSAWPAHIQAARGMVMQEARILNQSGGFGETGRGAGSGQAGKDAVATFREAFGK